jgi:hypothetical protein
MCGALSHAAASAAWANAASFARERHQPIQATPRTAKPREAASQRPAAQEVPKLVLNEPGQALPIPQAGSLGAKRLEVVPHHLVQDPRGGLPRLVGRRREGHATQRAEPMPLRAGPETWGYSGDTRSGRAVSAHAIGAAHSRCHATRRSARSTPIVATPACDHADRGRREVRDRSDA